MSRGGRPPEASGAVHLSDAAAWLVTGGPVFVLLVLPGAHGPGPRVFVAEIPAGGLLVAGEGAGATGDEMGELLGVPSTAARVEALDAASLRAHLAGGDGPASAARAVDALWTGAEGSTRTSAGVVPLEVGVVDVPPGAAAESTDTPLWVRAIEGDAALPEGSLPVGGALLGARVRVHASGGGSLRLEVRDLADPEVRDATPGALGALLARAAERARVLAAEHELGVLDDQHRRVAQTARAEEAAVARLAEVVTGPPPVPTPPPTTNPFLACASLVAAAAGMDVAVAPAVVEGREGTEAVRAFARAAGIRSRRVRLTGAWWRTAEDPLLGYLPDGTPVALLPVHERYQFVFADGRAVPVDASNADEALDVAFAFSASQPDAEDGAALVRFTLRGAGRDVSMQAMLGLVAAIVGLAIPLATGVVFDEIIPFGDTERLWILIGTLVLIALALAFLQGAQVARQVRIEARAARRLGDVTWDQVLRLPSSVASRYGVGDLAGRVVGVDTARELIGQAGLAGVTTILASVLVLGVLFFYDPVLALVALGGGILALAVTLLLAVRTGRRAERFQEDTAAVNGFLLQVLRGLPKLRVAGGEARAFGAWVDRFTPAMGIEVARAQAQLQLMNSVLPQLGTLLLFGSVALLGGPVAIGVGTFLAFQVAYGQFAGNVVQLSNTVGMAWQARPMVRRAVVVLREPPETGAGLADPGVLSGAVELRDVVFRYQPDAPPVLDGLSLRAGPGEFLAVVGHSGCGKSTLVRLLLGFETPDAGSVLYDERELGSLDVSAVRRQLGVVLQDSQLTPGSILENIAAGISLTDEEAWAYAEHAAMADDIRAMPMRLETMVTPGGGAFSGGQRQRLLLARALARRPSIVVLDEATSALDNITQGVIADNVARLGVTRIVIAHRLSTIAAADRIAVIANGRVAEQGTHDVLMSRGGPYADLVSRQMLETLDPASAREIA